MSVSDERLSRADLLKRAGMLGAGGIAVAGGLDVTNLRKFGVARAAYDASTRTLSMAALDVAKGLDGDIFKPGMQLAVVNLYDPLFDYPPGKTYPGGGQEVDATRVVPRLALSATPTRDGLAYIVKLRQGVRSSYGNELTANDVQWSWRKSFAQKRTGGFISKTCNVRRVNAIGKYTVRFDLNAPSPILLRALALYVPAIYDSTEARRHATPEDPWAANWIASNAAGFGAYRIESYKPDDQLVLVANPDYYRGKPYFSRVVIDQVPDPSSRVALLTAGRVGIVDQLNYSQLDIVRRSSRARVVTIPTGNITEQAQMNANFPPFNKLEVRQALNHAFDREQMISTVFQGRVSEQRSPIPATLPGYTPAFFKYEFNISRARQLLRSAGYGNGLDVTLNYSDIQWFDEPFAIQLQASARAAGININLQKMPSTELYDKLAIGRQRLPFFVIQELPIVLDPGYAMALTSLPDGISNRTTYSNPTLTRLVQTGNRTIDEKKRLQLFRAAQQNFVNNAPWVFGVNAGAAAALGRDVTGWIWHSDNMPRFFELRGK